MNLLPKFPIKQNQLGIGAIILVITVLILGGLGFAGSNYYASSQKKELKTLAKKESQELVNLKDKYRKIVDVIRENSGQTKQKDTVLGINSQNNPAVLGLEDSPNIISARKLNELYRDSRNLVKDIGDQNNQIKTKVNNPLIRVFLKSGGPVDKTNQFTADTNKILEFLEKTNSLEIKAATDGYELGVALGEAIIKNGEQSAIDRLNDKISLLDDIVKEEKTLAGIVPEELKEEFRKNLKNEDKVLTDFKELPDLIKNHDAVGLKNKVTDLSTAVSVETETGLVKLMDFWQNNKTIRATEELQKEWDSFSAQL